MIGKKAKFLFEHINIKTQKLCNQTEKPLPVVV